MSKTINIEYTDPVTGAEKTTQITIDVDRYRKDTELGDVENFFVKATGSGASPMLINVDDLIADILDARPSRPKKGVVQALIDTQFSANGTTLSVTPDADDAGFVALVPCVVLDKYGTEIAWFIPTVVAANITIPAANEGALAENCEIGWIVQQAKSFLSGEGENSQPGIKAQLERPNAPTAVAGTGGSATITAAHFTKPADVVITHYDIYVIKADVVPASIEPNCLPTIADRAASAASTGITLSEYFDEDDMTLKSLVAGTFFIGVIAKDGPGMVNVNESAIGWSVGITVSS